MDRRGERHAGPAAPCTSAGLGSPRDRQGGGTRQVRHAGRRGPLAVVGRGGLCSDHPSARGRGESGAARGRVSGDVRPRLVWWYTDEGRFAFEGEMPGAQGAVVADTLDRLAEAVPIMPGEEAMNHRDARRADALWALCSGHRASEHEPGRSCIVVHARLDELRNGGGGEVHCGPAVSAPTLERLACDARLELVIEDEAGDPIRVARGRRIPPPWLVRQIRHRDRGCRFPGCGSEAFTQVHHVRWWSRGGRTEAKNLILLCGFHHRLLHEAGWSIRLDPRGVPRWLRPDGTPHRSRAPAALPA